MTHPRYGENVTDPDSRRRQMVERQISSRGIHNRRVLEALAAVPRERFVPPALRGSAFDDRALPIGHGVTISQPYIVALMSELAQIEAGDRVLEIGTGSGYQAAVLVELGAEVYSVERIAAIYEQTRRLFEELGIAERVHMRHGDGFEGWPEHAPFAAIVLTAAPDEIPPTLVEQLALGGRLVAPVGGRWVQSLVVIERTEAGEERREVADVAFVPMLSGLA
ncbi:Protein-L-isoaspartate O-methyltransferase [Enhygromyxa salina]|uniref:Protein-L-isoaspartate O-methyltransferase n=1 Tax=Enhygromyxa salina TaxID=215803 RepID=A0A2S9XXT9_9BACT|nr:protein-L-isoaspartate(D-aspartate) O-methyltransferase [Enhygromyxa salina]PRP97541.1 Protein-L-isoaspartate O-methyltransferase [Enhygromyxa salina]